MSNMEWKDVRLGDIYEVRNGLSKGGKFFGSGYPFLSFSTVFKNYFLPDILDSLVQSSDKERVNFDIKRGDVFITRTSETAEELGMSSVALKDYPNATYNGFTKRLRPKDNGIAVLPEYIGYYLRSWRFRVNFLSLSGSMSTRASLANDDLLNLIVSLPNFEEQNKIAQILSSLDAKIENNNKINANLEAQAAALFKSWFVDFEPFRDGEFVESELGMIPKGWKVGNIGDYCKIKSGFAFKSSWWTDHGCKIIKIKNISESGDIDLNNCSYVLPENCLKAKDFKARPGDLVIAMTGATIGKFNVIPYFDGDFYINQRVGKFFLGENPLEKLPFILGVMNLNEVKHIIINKGQGSAQPNISGSDIESINIILPNEDVIATYNHLASPIFEILMSNRKENLRLSSLRDTLLPKLMSGEIDLDNISI